MEILQKVLDKRKISVILLPKATETNRKENRHGYHLHL